MGGSADLHKDNRNGAALMIPIGNGNRNTLSGLIDTHDNELTGAGFPGDIRRLYFEKMNVRGQVFPHDYSVHCSPLLCTRIPPEQGIFGS
jgi:hypothetical protein